MGARQSKRSVDITTTPKKGDESTASATVTEGEGKLEKIAEPDLKITTNGTLHNEIEYADKEESSKDEIEEPEKSPEEKTNETKGNNSSVPVEIKENGVPENESSNPEENESDETKEKEAKTPEMESKIAEEMPESKKKKEKKKKWSFRSISFSKKDKSKPAKDAKNGDVKEVTEENTEEKAATQSDLAKADNEAKPADIPAILEESTDTKSENKPEQSETVEDPVKELEAGKVPQVVAESNPEGVPESTKEVRTEEAPPPLPSSNPPSPVMVFAESTKAETALSAGYVPLEPSTDASAVESVASPPEISMSNSKEAPEPAGEVTPVLGLVESSVVEPRLISDTESSTTGPVKTEEQPSTPPPTPSAAVEMSSEIVSPPPALDIDEGSLESPPVVVSSLPVADLNNTPTEKQSESVSPISVKTDILQDLSEFISQPVQKHDPPENVMEVVPPPLESHPKEDVSEVVTKPCVGENISENLAPEAASSTPPTDIREDTSEVVAPADSLPDVSTESLPSLPEPVSESLPEPMSLPPVDSVPDPIAPLDSDPVVVTLTNGNTNGLPSSASSPADEHMTTALSPGPTKQIASETVKESEIGPESGDKPSEITKDVVAVEE